MRGGLRGSWSNTSFRYLVSTSTIKRVCANTSVLSPDLIAMRAMRLDCERADARRPRSLLITGGFHSSTWRSPVGAPDSVIACTGASTSASQCSRGLPIRSEEHTSELQSLMRISYAVFCLKKNKIQIHINRLTSSNTTQYYIK